MNLKKQFIHQANKKRIQPNDFDKISEVQSILTELGYASFTSQTLYSNKFIARERHPDLLINLNGEMIPLELDGSVHGSGDEISETLQTKYRNDDYFRAGFLPIILNEEWLELSKISKKTYLKCLLFNHSQILRAKRRVLI